MGRWKKLCAGVVLVAFVGGCAGFRFGPVWTGAAVANRPGGVEGQALSVPSVDEGQRFDLFVIGLAVLGGSMLLMQLPMAGALDDWTWSIPFAGPYIRWNAYSHCPEGTSCFAVLVNVFGVIITAAELTGLVLFLYSLLSEPDG